MCRWSPSPCFALEWVEWVMVRVKGSGFFGGIYQDANSLPRQNQKKFDNEIL